MYLKSLAASSHWMIQELPPCLMKRGFWEKNGEIVCSLCWSCFPCYTHQPEPTHQYWLVTAPSVVWIEGWAYKQWKYIAGPGIEPETTPTLIKSSDHWATQAQIHPWSNIAPITTLLILRLSYQWGNHGAFRLLKYAANLISISYLSFCYCNNYEWLHIRNDKKVN